MTRIWFSLLAMLLFAQVAQAALPNVIHATYHVHRGGMLIGSIDEKFERFGEHGDRYRITSRTRAEGAIALFYRDQFHTTSEGRIGTTGFIPAVFLSSRKSDTSRNFTTRFDWDKNELVREHLSDNQMEQEIFALSAGTQDRLSSMYQFMVVAPRGPSIATTMTQGKQAEQYVYLKQGEAKLSTLAGDFETVHYARDTKQGGTKAQMWLAKTKYHVPVRVVFQDTKGAIFEQTLNKLEMQ